MSHLKDGVFNLAKKKNHLKDGVFNLAKKKKHSQRALQRQPYPMKYCW